MNTYRYFWLGNIKARDHLEDVAEDGRIILNWILKKWGGRVWIAFFSIRMGNRTKHSVVCNKCYLY
jgi:hypothetical protein